jgi:DinB superfamily
MAIEPDSKDWTWVLRRPCPECGFEAGGFAREDVPALLTANAAAWVRLLAERSDADLRLRPDAHTWSPLEYACHVRDVFVLFDFRLGLMLAGDDPLFPNWDQDATAVASDYPTQQPAKVSAELDAAAQVLAGHFAELSNDQWARPGRRSDGASFTVESFARYLLHDPVHHLHDVS